MNHDGPFEDFWRKNISYINRILQNMGEIFVAVEYFAKIMLK